MIRRRALAAGIPTQIGFHTFHATGITDYLEIPGTSKWRNKWRTMRALVLPAFTTGALTR